jgi:hypothetical protein
MLLKREQLLTTARTNSIDARIMVFVREDFLL